MFSLIASYILLNTNKVNAVSETRYMRSDTQSINGLSAYQLGTSQTSSGLTTTYRVTGSGNGALTVNWGIRVWKRTSGGTETEITSGTPVAQVTRSSTTGSPGIQSATWVMPSTQINSTDSIIVRVYIQVGSSAWNQGGTAPNFTTEQLGNSSLDNVTWTVYYYTTYTNYNVGGPSGRWTQGDFSWGTTTFNSRIENFSRSTQNITVGSSGTQVTNLYPGSHDAHIGGAFTFIRDSLTTNVTSITISQTGTVTSANLTDLKLFYKTESSCSTTIPADATQFNSSGGTFSSGSSTVTGTMSVGTSQVCVYAKIDISTGASAGETIEFQITNPSTQVLVSNGTTSPGTAVVLSGTTTLITGYLALSIVDESDATVSSPTVDFETKTFSFNTQQSTGILGTTSQKIKIINYTTTPAWTLSMAATYGNTSLWQSGGYTFDYNGTQSQGRLEGNHSSGSLTPSSGCSTSSLSFQSAAFFSQGSVDSINLLIATSGADIVCHWYMSGLQMVQDIPASQPAGNYTISMTLTLI